MRSNMPSAFILHPSSFTWKPAEELNLVPFRPALTEVRFRRPMPGTRAKALPIADFQLSIDSVECRTV